MPALEQKRDQFLLKEVVKRWTNHQHMQKYLSFFSSYLDRFFIPRRQLLPLRDVSLKCFKDQVSAHSRHAYQAQIFPGCPI